MGVLRVEKRRAEHGLEDAMAEVFRRSLRRILADTLRFAIANFTSGMLAIKLRKENLLLLKIVHLLPFLV